MKKIGLLIFAFALVIGLVGAFSTSFGKLDFSFRSPKIVGSGISKTDWRDAVDFQNVETSGAMNVEIMIANEFHVEVEADDNLIEHVKTETDGNTLKIYSDGWLNPKSKMIVRVSMPELTEASASGASKIDIQGLKNDDLSLETSGASSVKANGTAKTLEIKLSGASKIDAENLISEFVAAKASGASSAIVSASEDLEANASGASRIVYVGAVKNVNKRTSGGSTVKARE